MEWKNALTDLLSIEYPIIQAPMLGVTTPEMVAAIANQGGLGSLPAGGLSPDKTRDLIHKTKSFTSRPFAVNLFAHPIPAINQAQVSAMQAFLAKLAEENNLPYEPSSQQVYSFHEQIPVLLEEQIPVVSFTFGILDEQSIHLLKQAGTILIGTATCVKEAILLGQSGIDIVTAQGIEAGGHRGTFLTEEPLPLIGLFSLLPQLRSKISKPILAAGGISDGKSIQAAFTLGAQGVQIGTAFIASNESAAVPSYKQALTQASDTDAILTRAFSGRWARGLKNTLITQVELSGLAIPEYPFQNSLTQSLRASSQNHNNKEFTTLWAGQSAFAAQAKPCSEIFTRFIREVEEL
jgi:nitronate monooxygenase